MRETDQDTFTSGFLCGISEAAGCVSVELRERLTTISCLWRKWKQPVALSQDSRVYMCVRLHVVAVSCMYICAFIHVCVCTQ